jgi:hypothetical protein
MPARPFVRTVVLFVVFLSFAILVRSDEPCSTQSKTKTVFCPNKYANLASENHCDESDPMRLLDAFGEAYWGCVPSTMLMSHRSGPFECADPGVPPGEADYYVTCVEASAIDPAGNTTILQRICCSIQECYVDGDAETGRVCRSDGWTIEITAPYKLELRCLLGLPAPLPADPIPVWPLP